MQHVFKTHGLRRHLDIVVDFFPLPAMLEFDGKYRAVRMKLHEIGLADQAEPT